MSSVKFEASGRTGRTPLSFFAPLTVSSDKKFWNVLPKNAVPTGKGNAKQQVGYWNEQPRWRMQRGERVEKPSYWHFYFLGTGPHADAKFRERIPGVVWVSKANADLNPTNLGTRSKARSVITPKFDSELPSDIEIVDKSSAPNSRGNSRSQSRGPGNGANSRNNSKGRNNTNSRDNSNNRGKSQSRNSSRNRGQQRNNNQQRQGTGAAGNGTADLAAAIVLALEKAGLTRETEKAPKKESANNNKKSESRASSPAPAQSKKDQLGKVMWKRNPDPSFNVTQCFGPRSVYQNFGDEDAIKNGVKAKHFPSWAELTPTPAALLFGSEVITVEDGDDIVIQYNYQMRVPKTMAALQTFLPQVGAYANGDNESESGDQPGASAAAAAAPEPPALPPKLNPKADAFVPPKINPNYFDGMKVEIMNKTISDDSTA
ncbi:nucleocapsid protein [BtMr-AlphaCoV/SAX2011]|uniref:Nucleoprotein n=1 Tax=BtMr-AlphaCoV/SAX2011 TaxID=1503289 RepID=A0A0U1WHF1_9ALPC|nr:nucleocapsid protein [BtMr-AlphaCoV/SAX2011]AIA62250.1 nucleocapsid protein [BtMr-AlphaCoV/SAX2011]